MPLETTLDRLHARVTDNRWMQRLTALTRVLLAIGFIPPGLTKVLGKRFTLLSPETTVGGFFEVFFQAEEYYLFVGAMQMLAGLLLLIPRTAALGTVLYLPIILNIFVITVALPFRGTWMITSMMLLAATYLLLWDFDKWKRLLFPHGSPIVKAAPTLSWAQMVMGSAHAAFLLSGLGLLFAVAGPLSAQDAPVFLFGLGVAGVLAVAGWWLGRRPGASVGEGLSDQMSRS